MDKLSDEELVRTIVDSIYDKDGVRYWNIIVELELLRRLDKGRKATEWQPIETAPKDKLILLYLPEFGCSAATWWSGQWSWELKTWVIRTPFLSDNKIVMASDIPFPLGWIELPDAIADYEKEQS